VEIRTYEKDPQDTIKSLESQVKAKTEALASARLEANDERAKREDAEEERDAYKSERDEARVERDIAIIEKKKMANENERLEKIVGKQKEQLDSQDETIAGLKEFLITMESLEGQRKQEITKLEEKMEKLEKAKRPIDKLEWHEHLVHAIRKLIPFIK